MRPAAQCEDGSRFRNIRARTSASHSKPPCRGSMSSKSRPLAGGRSACQSTDLETDAIALPFRCGQSSRRKKPRFATRLLLGITSGTWECRALPFDRRKRAASIHHLSSWRRVNTAGRWDEAHHRTGEPPRPRIDVNASCLNHQNVAMYLRQGGYHSVMIQAASGPVDPRQSAPTVARLADTPHASGPSASPAG